MKPAVLTALSTFALVLVTTYYALQNHRMVREMRAGRELSLQPKLSIRIFMLGPTFGIPRLANVGQGPALDVDVNLVFVRRDGANSPERKWLAPVMPIGETHDFLPPEHQDIGSMKDFARVYHEVRVEGRMTTALGSRIDVSETTGDLQEWFEMSAAALHVWDEAPTRKVATELEGIRKELEKLVRRPYAG